MYAALRVETTAGTPLKPNTFFPITKVDIVAPYGAKPSVPILATRTMNINPIKNLIEAPSGSIGLQVEPKTIGFFLRAIYGAITSGRYFPTSGVTGTFQVGETVTGGTSAATATVLAVSAEKDYLIMGSPTGTFTAAGEAITGGTSGATATLGVNASTVYGHEATAPQTSLPTFTLEIGLANEVIRWGGVTFHGFNSIAHNDNIITAELSVMALWEFKHARVTAVTTAGSTKTITVDQTTGLTTSDSVKIFRPSTGAFIDLNGSGVKSETVASVPTELTFTLATLTDATAVGDLVMLAPQTPSYSLAKEFSWIGGSVGRFAADIDTAVAASAANIEEFELSVMNELESRHAANGTNVINRFPYKNHLKKFTGEGKIKRAYENMTLLDYLRRSAQFALQIRHTADQIASTGVYYTLDWRVPYAVFKPWNPPVEQDNILDEDASFDIFRSSADGYDHKALLVNEVTSY